MQDSIRSGPLPYQPPRSGVLAIAQTSACATS
ncbi:hypothetical protein LINGRAHAP2_LOCUS10057 [Linum grandiflorum]